MAAFGLVAVLHGPGGRTASVRLPAEVRFANQLSGKQTWSVMANAAPMFANVPAGTTTAYVAVTDSVSRLTLRRSGSDSVQARTSYRFFAGSYYTITADYRNGGNIPVLSVQRDRPPGDTMP
jgi:hypothetical protein